MNPNSPRLACDILEAFIISRLCVDAEPEWIERTFVTRIWICVDRMADDENTIEFLNLFLSSCSRNGVILRASAVHAVQTVGDHLSYHIWTVLIRKSCYGKWWT